jgi:homoserine kinase
MPKENLKIQIPASSSNLGPGFDCFGLALTIHNEYDIEFIDSYDEFEINSNLKDEFCPNNKENLFYKAFQILFRKEGFNKIPSIKVELNAQIPCSGGFGSSGTAVLGGLVAANNFLECKYEESELLKEACLIEKHPDNVCASLLGGFCLSSFEDEKLISKKIDWQLEEVDILMLYPLDFRVNTDEARKILKENHPIKSSVSNLSNSAFFTAAVLTEDLELLKESIKDKIHEQERLQLIPGASEIISMAKEQSAIGATISGSGASLIVFLDSKSNLDIIKDKAKEIWAKNKLESESILCKVSNSGALIY